MINPFAVEVSQHAMSKSECCEEKRQFIEKKVAVLSLKFQFLSTIYQSSY
jgi:hypothetical protein